MARTRGQCRGAERCAPSEIALLKVISRTIVCSMRSCCRGHPCDAHIWVSPTEHQIAISCIWVYKSICCLADFWLVDIWRVTGVILTFKKGNCLLSQGGSGPELLIGFKLHVIPGLSALSCALWWIEKKMLIMGISVLLQTCVQTSKWKLL